MRHVISAALIGFLLQGAPPAEPPDLTADDLLAAKLWRIAVATHTRIGFEATDHVKFPGKLQDVPPLAVSTIDDSLNTVLGDRYEWGKAGDIIIVRPTGEWKNPSNPFNRPIRNVQVQQAWSNGVLGGVRDFIYTNSFAVDRRPNGGVPAVSIQLPAGTVVDLLNALITAADQIMWVAAYVPVGKSARFPKWDLTLDLRDTERLTGYTGSYPPKRK